MQAIGDLWWLWLFIWVVCHGYAVINQAGRMGRMISDPEAAFGSFTKGLGSFLLAGFAGSVSLVLFVVAVIINLAG